MFADHENFNECPKIEIISLFKKKEDSKSDVREIAKLLVLRINYPQGEGFIAVTQIRGINTETNATSVYVWMATNHQAKAGSERTKEIADFDLGRSALKPT